MGLAPIRFPENPSYGKIALPEPDGGKPHPYSSVRSSPGRMESRFLLYSKTNHANHNPSTLSQGNSSYQISIFTQKGGDYVRQSRLEDRRGEQGKTARL